MQPTDSKEEPLREALLNVQRLREKERAALEQSETLIKGLQILNESNSVTDIFREILGTLQRVIPFHSAAVLVESSEGQLSTALCTDNRLKFSRIPIAGVFKRCLEGQATVLTKLELIEDWPVVESTSGDPLSSALLVSLTGLKQSTLIVCSSTNEYKLRRQDLNLLMTFAPLATQAVKRAGELENLSMLVSKLDYYAHFDMLTGLPNRTLFDIRLEKELAIPENDFAVLFLDLDHFKYINDTYGHNTGDVLLSEIGFRISGIIGTTDTIARMGGDEFALIIRDKTDVESLCALSDRLIERISRPLFLCKNCLEPSASIGIVSSAQQVGTAQSIMQNADIALYDAKNNGRQCFSLFNLAMRNRLKRRNEIERKLRLVLDNQELRLAYQPIFSSDTLDCHLVEVLVRWEIDGVTQFYPDEFIPVAEQNGNMCDIGLWIFIQALTDLYKWLHDDKRRTVAINLSDVQLHDTNLADQLTTLMVSTGVNPQQVELELSERIVAADINETVSTNLSALQEKGFRFSFDDFGTGQSSFLHLQNFPGTTLKIDKTFIDNLVTSEDQRKLVKGIVNFAHSLDLLVVAEGVETDQQLHILSEMNCDLLQGFLLAKPMTYIEFLAQYNSEKSVLPHTALLKKTG